MHLGLKHTAGSKLTGVTFTALTPSADLFEFILSVLTPLGCDFWAQVDQTRVPGPPQTPKKPCFCLCLFNLSRNA